MDERRGATRWSVCLPVRYLDLPSHKEGSARTKDLSTVGAQVETVEKHKPGDRVDLMLDLPGNATGRVCIEANVIWQANQAASEEGCNYLTGLEFKRVRDCHKQTILDYVIDNKPEQVRSRWWEGLKP